MPQPAAYRIGHPAVVEMVDGGRFGPFIVLRDQDGLRHAVRQGAILSISEVDDDGGCTFIAMHGGRSALVRRTFDQVIAWFT